MSGRCIGWQHQAPSRRAAAATISGQIALTVEQYTVISHVHKADLHEQPCFRCHTEAARPPERLAAIKCFYGSTELGRTIRAENAPERPIGVEGAHVSGRLRQPTLQHQPASDNADCNHGAQAQAALTTICRVQDKRLTSSGEQTRCA
jgi:hypothetical protein